MKSFLSALAALAVITVAANYVLTDVLGDTSAERTAARDVRLPGERLAAE